MQGKKLKNIVEEQSLGFKAASLVQDSIIFTLIIVPYSKPGKQPTILIRLSQTAGEGVGRKRPMRSVIINNLRSQAIFRQTHTGSQHIRSCATNSNAAAVRLGYAVQGGVSPL